MVPMCMVGECDRAAAERRREAERQVRAKFPALQEGTMGWHRAVTNRYNRIRIEPPK